MHRLVRAFVAPADVAVETPELRVAAPERPPAVAVLAPPERAAAVGGAVALGLAKGPVVVAVWGARPTGRRVPASPGARAIATKLVARGHDAVATGRLGVVTLEAPGESARIAAAVDVPCVLVVAGPRDARVDRALRDHDQVVVAGDDLVATVAVESVRALGVSAETLTLPDALTARTLAASGVALVAPWRATVEAAIQ